MARSDWTPAQRAANRQWDAALIAGKRLKRAGMDSTAEALYATLAQAVAEAVRVVLSTSNGHPASPLDGEADMRVHARACSPRAGRPTGVQSGRAS